MSTSAKMMSVKIDSAKQQAFSQNYVINEDTRMILEIVGDREMCLDIDVAVKDGCRFFALLINHNDSDLKINDHYSFGADCTGSIAYCHLNNHGCSQNSRYDIDGQGTEIKAVTATLTGKKCSFQQETFHNAFNSKAAIDNYGVVMHEGYCDYVVKNTIKEKITGCRSTQSSHLLTLDKESGGRILPVLYIDNNDVQAAHAATMGQPDENTLFYLQTRGLSHREALQLIASGYLKAVIADIDDDEVSEILMKEIEEKVVQCLM